VGLKFVI